MVYLYNGILFNDKKSKVLITSGKEPTCQYRRCKRRGFNPRIGKIPWRGAWQPTPVFLPEKSHGQRSLVGYSPWDRKELDTTKHAHTHHTGCYRRSSWDLLSITWPALLSSQHLELSALHQHAFAATTVSLWNVSSKAKATTTTSTPQTLLLFSPFSFLNNTVSVLVQSFKKNWA